jgi:hypothetical protein
VYLVLILLVAWAFYWVTNMIGGDNTITHNQYQQMLADGVIKEVLIIPNEETPTGEIRILTTEDKTYQLYTDDVAEARQELLAAGVEVGYSKSVKSGFKVGAKNGGYYISFSDEDFNALLGEYLRDKVAALIFGK